MHSPLSGMMTCGRLKTDRLVKWIVLSKISLKIGGLLEYVIGTSGMIEWLD